MFDDDRITDVTDLLIVTETVLTVLVYEAIDGWISVAEFDDTTKFDEAVAAILDYRDYALSDDDTEMIVEEYQKLFDEEFD